MEGNLSQKNIELGLDQFLPKQSRQRYSQKCIRRPFQIVYVPKTQRTLPLKKIDYDLNVQLGVQQVTVTQEYENDLQDIMEIEYVFAINPDAAFTDLDILIGDKTVKAVLKEKEEAKAEYDEGVKQGYTMAYSEQVTETPDLMKIKLGNLLPHLNLKVRFSYVQPLEVCVNQFWRIVIPSTTTPRYNSTIVRNDQELLKCCKTRYQNHFLNNLSQSIQQGYTWNINIIIQDEVPITFYKSPTHNILNLGAKENSKQLQITLDPTSNNNLIPNKDFVLLFQTQKIHEPRVSIEHTIRDELQQEKYCAQISFIPAFNQIPMDDAYTAYLEDNELQNDEYQFEQKGTYFFLIDRSGSMRNNRIEKAKEALILFIKSLPIDSYFNVCSFGSTYSFMFKEPQKFSQESMDNAVRQIEFFRADMGGTEIFQGLQSCYKNFKFKGYPNNVFMLTDGSVSNPDQVINFIQNNRNAQNRVYSLGIGNGCSRYLVERVAELGNGIYEFVGDNENLTEKVIFLLQDSITPFLHNFKMELHNGQQVQAIIPDPSSIIQIKKNEPFTTFMTMNSEFQQCEVKITCEDQNGKQYGFQTIIDAKQSIQSEINHQLCAYKQIQSFEQAARLNKVKSNDILLAKQNITNSYLIQLSMQYSVLCCLTAFVCEIGKNQTDEIKQQFDQTNKIKVVVPQIQSTDYADSFQKKYRSKAPQQIQQILDSANLICYTSARPMSGAMRAYKGSNLKMAKSKKKVVEKKNDIAEYEQDKDGCFDEDAIQIVKQEIQSQKVFETNLSNKNYMEIVMLQQVNGSFRIDEKVFNKQGLTQQMLQLKPDELEMEHWVTILIMTWLEVYFSEDKSSWQLVYKKAKQSLGQIKYNQYKELAQDLLK